MREANGEFLFYFRIPTRGENYNRTARARFVYTYTILYQPTNISGIGSGTIALYNLYLYNMYILCLCLVVWHCVQTGETSSYSGYFQVYVIHI